MRQCRRAVHIKCCNACQKRKNEVFFLTLNVYEIRTGDSYDVIFLSGKAEKPVLAKSAVSCARDVWKIQKFVLCMSAVVHVGQYVEI